jgi:hypothetical protein
MSLIYLIQSFPMEGMIGDAVQSPETENETGADQVSSVSLDPINRSLRRIGRKFDAIEIRSHSPEGIDHRFEVMKALYLQSGASLRATSLLFRLTILTANSMRCSASAGENWR